MINVRMLGVYLTRTYDASSVRNVEVWNTTDFSLGNCVGFKLAHNDELRMTDCFTEQCKIGYQFVAVAAGRTRGTMTSCTSDACQWGIQVDAAERLQITGGNHLSHWRALTLQGPGQIIVSGAELASNGDNNVLVSNCSSLTLTGCRLGKNGAAWSSVYMINLKGGNSALISGCTFDGTSAGILIQPPMRNFSITGNIFQSTNNPTITDRTTGKTPKVVANNLFAN
jgi:hypothetical protein